MNHLSITDVRAHPGDSAFLIDDGKTAILIDSGYGFTAHLVAARIQQELVGRPLDYIFLTHSHYDHALGSATLLQYWPEVKVVAGEYATKIFQKDSAKTTMRDLDRKVAASCGVYQYEDCADDLRVDLPVKDGDTVQAGDLRFTAVNLPGHTRCSVGFYLAEQKFLIGTETLGVKIGNGAVLPCFLVGYQLALDSIAKAEAMDIDALLLPHSGILNREESRAYLAEGRKSAVATAETVVSMLRAGKSKQEAVDYIIAQQHCGPVLPVYPKPAMVLNTTIMVDLIERELLNSDAL